MVIIMLYFLIGAMAGAARAQERQRQIQHDKEMEEKMNDLLALQAGTMTPEEYARKTEIKAQLEVARIKRITDPYYEDKQAMLKAMKPNVWYRADQCFSLPFYYAKNKKILEKLFEDNLVKRIENPGFFNENQYQKI